MLYWCDMQDLVEKLADALSAKRITLASAESCTGGMLAAAITDRAGASRHFERGFVTYSNESKIEMLDVDAAIIAEKGAVSAETAEAMARGAVRNSRADLAIAITGIAGPDGDEHKPVGLVFIACADADMKVIAEKHHFTGNRDAIRLQSAKAAIHLLLKKLS